MLRDYQVDICNRVTEALRGHRSVMLQMPTGTGKTVVLAELVKRFLCSSEETVMIVAHRRELVLQIKEHVGVVLERVQVCSVQWLWRNLDGLDEAPGLVVVDEAHHAVAQSYRLLWEAWPDARFLGLTATPYRLSGEGFTQLFEVLVESWSVQRFIAEGWLAPFDYFSILPDSEEQRLINGLKKRGADGDFQLKELSEQLDRAPRIERLIEAFFRFARQKKGIVYAIDIAHAEHVAERFRLHGVAAAAISSKTPMELRKALITAFKRSTSAEAAASDASASSAASDASALQVLVNVDLFSEGFDCPDVEFVQLARPTLSLAKFLQMVGRGLRISEGKRDCLILDHVGLYRRFGLPSADRDWRGFFLGGGACDAAMGEGPATRLMELGLELGALREPTDEGLVRVASATGMTRRMAARVATGFVERRRGKRGVWMDTLTGVTFAQRPMVVELCGVELATADGEWFFPRIGSKWVDGEHGICRQALETQVGNGLSWMKRYVWFGQPDRVFELLEVLPSQARVYRDEAGSLFFQQDLDGELVSEEEAGGRDCFVERCAQRMREWDVLRRGIGKRTLKRDAKRGWWRLPPGATCERMAWEGQTALELYHVVDVAQGREFWLDGTSGFTYAHRPRLRRRGFVELLVDGELVYVLNIGMERFRPYRNWEVRADERIGVIGNKLYFSDRMEAGGLRIRRRSEDFRLFVVEQRQVDERKGKVTYEELMIINKSGKPLEISVV